MGTLIYSPGAYRAQADRYQDWVDRFTRQRDQYLAEGNRRNADRITPMIETYTALVREFAELAEHAEKSR